MNNKVRKAVIPCAGLGTRFLPATKAMAKEMLPIVDIPTLQYQIKEAVDAGIEEVILIISNNKEEIKKHFQRDIDYENYLYEKGKYEEAKLIKDISTITKITYVVQEEQKGLGHAILCAKEAVGDEPFVVILGDDLIINENGKNVSSQMIDIYDKYHCSVIGCQNVEPSQVNKYGIMALKNKMENRIGYLLDMVEKPKLEDAPSTLACLGRYLLTSDIFAILENTKPGKGGEIQLTDAIKILAKDKDVIVYDFVGNRYDIGDKFGYVKAVIDFSLKRDDMKDKVLNHIKNVLSDNKD